MEQKRKLQIANKARLEEWRIQDALQSRDSSSSSSKKEITPKKVNTLAGRGNDSLLLLC